MPRLAAPLSGYIRLLNSTNNGDVLNITVNPVAGMMKGRPLNQKTVHVGFWMRKNTTSGPTLIGPIAFSKPHHHTPVPSPYPLFTWRQFWKVVGKLNVHPVIARAIKVPDDKAEYIKSLYRKGRSYETILRQAKNG